MEDLANIYLSTLVPMVVEETNRGERAYDIYSRLLSLDLQNKERHRPVLSLISVGRGKPGRSRVSQMMCEQLSQSRDFFSVQGNQLRLQGLVNHDRSFERRHS